MAHKAANGWIAPCPDDCDLKVKDETSGRKVKSTGLFVHKDYEIVYFNFAGLPEGKTAKDFRLPAHADFLREVAAAIEMAADDIDRIQGR